MFLEILKVKLKHGQKVYSIGEDIDAAASANELAKRYGFTNEGIVVIV